MVGEGASNEAEDSFFSRQCSLKALSTLSAVPDLMEAIMPKRTSTENGHKGCRQGWGRFSFLEPPLPSQEKNPHAHRRVPDIVRGDPGGKLSGLLLKLRRLALMALVNIGIAGQ